MLSNDHSSCDTWWIFIQSSAPPEGPLRADELPLCLPESSPSPECLFWQPVLPLTFMNSQRSNTLLKVTPLTGARTLTCTNCKSGAYHKTSSSWDKGQWSGSRSQGRIPPSPDAVKLRGKAELWIFLFCIHFSSTLLSCNTSSWACHSHLFGCPGVRCCIWRWRTVKLVCFDPSCSWAIFRTLIPTGAELLPSTCFNWTKQICH